jgi:hypothetical protein
MMKGLHKRIDPPTDKPIPVWWKDTDYFPSPLPKLPEFNLKPND